MYRMYADIHIVEENYNAMAKWIHYIQSYNPTFVWKTHLNANFGDWLSINSTTPKEVLATAYFAYDTLLMSKMARALNKISDVEKYTQLFQNITKAFNNEFVDQASGKIKGETQTCYALALAFQLLPSNLIPKAAKHLVDDIKDKNYRLSTGFVGK